MFQLFFNKRPLVDECGVVRVNIFVRYCALGLKDKFKILYGKGIDLRFEDSIKKFIKLVGKGVNINLRKEKINGVDSTKPNNIILTYTLSNLGKGFIFWFVCNGCGRRVRFLYIPPHSEDFLCRVCHRLVYKN